MNEDPERPAVQDDPQPTPSATTPPAATGDAANSRGKTGKEVGPNVSPDGRTTSDRQGAPGALPLDLQEDRDAIERIARAKGLKFWPTDFEVISRRKMVELGTYVLPYRWAHWTFGREYARMQKLHDLGLVDILELVVNTRPARAFLLDANSRDENRMVMAHVFGHVDFFANNMWFERTPDNVLQEAHHHERRFRDLQEMYPPERVEKTLDHALAIQWHVDFYRHYEEAAPRRDTGGPADAHPESRVPNRRGPTPHQPPAIEPEGGHRDLLEFLIVHADLDELEREVLEAIREETLYFYPNALTKIMNEGWATYWHAQIMQEFLPFEAFDRFAVKHSHLMMSQGLNPYKLGFLIYEDIRARGDREFGPGTGLRHIFDARRYGDDVSFLREHLTQEIVDKAGLYLYEENPETGERVVTSTRLEDVRGPILAQMENFGKPLIVVKSGAHGDAEAGAGDLLLEHRFDGREIDLDYAGDVLKEIQAFWKRGVHLDTFVDGKRSRLSLTTGAPRLVSLETEATDGSAPAQSEPKANAKAPAHTGASDGAGSGKNDLDQKPASQTKPKHKDGAPSPRPADDDEDDGNAPSPFPQIGPGPS